LIVIESQVGQSVKSVVVRSSNLC